MEVLTMVIRAWWLMAALAIASVAEGQLVAPVRECIDAYHNRLRLVSQQAGTSYRACLHGSARSGGAAGTCLAGDAGGRIAAREAAVQALYDRGVCTGDEPIQRGATAGSAAHRDAAADLVRDLFGDPVTAAVGGVSGDESRCLDTAVKRAVQAFGAVVMGHRDCARRGLESGAVRDAATLDAACGTFAQIDTAGAAQARLTRLAADVALACGPAAARLPVLFPGVAQTCHGSADALGGCVAARTRCRACRAVAEADGQPIDCDRFDDGEADGSCAADPAPARRCTLAAGSQMLLLNSALPLPLALRGALDIRCADANGTPAAPCSCALRELAPLVVPAIGDVCVAAAPGCPSGGISCDGTAPRDVAMDADHNIGSCTSNAACAAACDARCAGLGATYVRQASGCEGFCAGGAAADQPCTGDSCCPGASCVGGEPVAHPGVCNCVCEGRELGGAGADGALDCTLGVQLHVERPSDGRCTGAAVETLPPSCIGLTTATATGIDRNSDNNSAGLSLPYSGPSSITGAATSCAAFAAGDLAGLRLVGHSVVFDTTLGDNLARLSLVCE